MRAIAFLSTFITGYLTSVLAIPANAQVTPEGTVNSSVSKSGNDFTITNGSRIGNNLFHSFSQFSVPSNGSAFFNNASDIQNIFSRVIPIHEKPDTNKASKIKPQPVIEATIDVLSCSRRCHTNSLNSFKE